MNGQPLKLHVPEPVREVLVRLLRTALELPERARVVDHVPLNPWGDVDEFQRTIFLPLHGQEAPKVREVGDVEVTIEPQEIAPVRDVLDGLAESVSGGNPWVALTEAERRAVADLVARLDDPG